MTTWDTTILTDIIHTGHTGIGIAHITPIITSQVIGPVVMCTIPEEEVLHLLIGRVIILDLAELLINYLVLQDRQPHQGRRM